MCQGQRTDANVQILATIGKPPVSACGALWIGITPRRAPLV
eukprot:COSAG02_NODE_6051_length_3842_cov_7.726423_4_plen_41_part_00